MAKAQKQKVMIVEDNQMNLKLFRDLLVNDGFDVVDTEDGSIAVEMAKAQNPDLILMDIQLKNISGIDIIKTMKADDALRHIPIIAVTAFAMKEDRDRIEAAGCDAYISKPIYVGPFLDEVRSLVK